MIDVGLRELVEATGGLKEEDYYIYHFKPVPMGFVYLVCHDRDRFFLGGNRSSKTFTLVYDFCVQFTGRCPRWLKEAGYPEWRLKPTRKLRLMFSDYVNKFEEIWGYIQLFVPPGDIVETQRSDGRVRRIVNKHGGFIEFMSYGQDTSRLAGVARDAIGIDEVCPHDAYKESAFRFGANPVEISFAATPLTEEQRGTVFHPYFAELVMGAWTYYEKLPGENKITRSINLAGKKGRAVFYASVFDNEHVDQQEAHDKVEDADPVTQLTRERGKLIIESGVIYKNFNIGVHVVNDFDDWWQSPEDWSIYVAIDCHKELPHYVTVLGAYRDGRMFVVDEIHEHTFDTQEFVDLLKERLRGTEPVKIVIDPLGKEKEPSSGKRFSYDLYTCGLRPAVKSATKLLVRGIPAVSRALGAYRKGTDGKWRPEPRLFFQAHCTEHIRHIRSYMWSPPSKVSGELKQEPYQKSKYHYMENINRIISISPRWAQDEVSLEMAEWQGLTINQGKEGRDEWTGY